MRKGSTLSTAAYGVAGILLMSTAAVADWHNPYFYRQTSGSWTNAEYNDGVCHYYYAYNSYDQDLKVSRYGDCSHVAIAPDGTAVPVTMVPLNDDED